MDRVLATARASGFFWGERLSKVGENTEIELEK